MPINNPTGVTTIPGLVFGLASPQTTLSYPGSTFANPYGIVLNSTNIQSIDTNRFIGIGANLEGSISGIPQVAQIGSSLLSNSDSYNPGFAYTSVPFYRLNKIAGVLYQDFRNREGQTLERPTQAKQPAARATSYRLDGAVSATKKSEGRGFFKSRLYAIAAASPAGAYSVFNREANGMFGAGWGDHGNIYALRNDFTAQSHIATTWKDDGTNSKWVPTRNPLSILTPFRGDRVQVIDFHRNTDLDMVYKWRNTESSADTNILDRLGITQDFIKFFFTGPKLGPGEKASPYTTNKDSAIIFRASITSLSDTFQPGWNSVALIGRADGNHHYGSYSRDLSFNFTVYATDRDELKPIWRKLNALAGYTAPKYSDTSIALEAPWIRFTLGDLYFQQPAIITSLVYTLQDNDTTWEINIEQDPGMMQVPKKIEVQMGLTLITNELPEQDGKFYTLANRFHRASNKAISGTDNWLSDFKQNYDPTIDDPGS